MNYKRKFDHFVTDDTRISNLKSQERSLNNKDKSRNIERRRRLLTEDQGRRKGPLAEDQPNIYDYYAIRVQTLIRGFLVRCWMSWYRKVSLAASIMLQSVVRGWLGRTRMKTYRKRFIAARNIQRNFRGWKARVSSIF